MTHIETFPNPDEDTRVGVPRTKAERLGRAGLQPRAAPIAHASAVYGMGNDSFIKMLGRHGVPIHAVGPRMKLVFFDDIDKAIRNEPTLFAGDHPSIAE